VRAGPQLCCGAGERGRAVVGFGCAVLTPRARARDPCGRRWLKRKRWSRTRLAWTTTRRRTRTGELPLRERWLSRLRPVRRPRSGSSCESVVAHLCRAGLCRAAPFSPCSFVAWLPTGVRARRLTRRASCSRSLAPSCSNLVVPFPDSDLAEQARRVVEVDPLMEPRTSRRICEVEGSVLTV
jgi:hypothetical protein